MNIFLFLLNITEIRVELYFCMDFFSNNNLSDEKRMDPLCRLNFFDHGVDRGDQWNRSCMDKIYSLVIRSHHSPCYIFKKLNIMSLLFLTTRYYPKNDNAEDSSKIAPHRNNKFAIKINWEQVSNCTHDPQPFHPFTAWNKSRHNSSNEIKDIKNQDEILFRRREI